jgi:hypothetical protein
MDKPRPYLTAALLCETVLEEKDGTLSVIHIADRLTYSMTGVPEGVKPATAISGLICLKSGPVTGEHIIKIFAENPLGERKEVYAHPITLLGGDQGQNIKMRISLVLHSDGLYWIDIVFDDDVLTRIPLTVVQEQKPVQTEQKT